MYTRSHSHTYTQHVFFPVLHLRQSFYELKCDFTREFFRQFLITFVRELLLSKVTARFHHSARFLKSTCIAKSRNMRKVYDGDSRLEFHFYFSLPALDQLLVFARR